MGPHETCLRRNLDSLGVEANAYFGGEVSLVGNYWHKILVDFREKKKSLMTFLEPYPDLYKLHDEAWEKISAIEKFMATPNPSPEYAEEAAKMCEEFGEIFPMNFPEKSLTKKIHTLVYVMPKYIREQNICHLMLKLEQAGEKLHNILNTIGQ